MTSINVKTLLFISSADRTYSHCFLFHCAKYWADKGEKILYITNAPVEDLPQSIGAPRNAQNLENFSLIQFMYLPSWQDILKQCYSVHLQQNPVSVIIVQELENYCYSGRIETHDHFSLVCASLLHAASVCAYKKSKTTYLISGYNSKNNLLPRTLTKNFFHDIWRLSVEVEASSADKEKKLVKLTNLSPGKTNDVKLFVFSENKEKEFLDFESAFESMSQVSNEER